MVSKAIDGEGVVLGDEFVADEILTRLPARCAVHCTVLSKRFRQLVASEHFWLRHCRLGAPLELPHAARLYRHGDRKVFDFHMVGPAFSIKHTVKVKHPSWYTSNCNGLVFLSSCSNNDKGQSSIDGIVFNPATKEEAQLSLPLPHPRKGDVLRQILGFGYGPSSKFYKALICEADDKSTRLLVVSLDGSGGQEPRTVFSSDEGMSCTHCLHTTGGKVYFFMYPINWIDYWDVLWVLAFDLDSEAVTKITTPEGQDISTRMLLQVHGRPCIYTEKVMGHEITLWLLTSDHRWEQLYILVKESSQPGDYLMGVWDCGGGLLFAEFEHSGAYMYNLHEAVEDEEEGSNCRRLAAMSSLKFEDKWPWYNCLENMWDYRPTIISPMSIFSDAAFSDHGHESVATKHELDGTFLDMTHKSVDDPMLRMLSALRPQSG